MVYRPAHTDTDATLTTPGSEKDSLPYLLWACFYGWTTLFLLHNIKKSIIPPHLCVFDACEQKRDDLQSLLRVPIWVFISIMCPFVVSLMFTLITIYLNWLFVIQIIFNAWDRDALGVGGGIGKDLHLSTESYLVTSRTTFFLNDFLLNILLKVEKNWKYFFH